MTPEAFSAACRVIYGAESLSDIAEVLGVSERSVSFWRSGQRPLPAGVVASMARDLRERLADPTCELLRLALESTMGTKAA
jgi:DNA-binding transcriptional regulator YdaS (Cro superfamily)